MQLVDIFPVRKESIPRMQAFSLGFSSGTSHSIGGKLGYRFTNELDGTWFWSDSRLITDSKQPVRGLLKKAERIIGNLWETQPNGFRRLQEIYADSTWKPSARAQADYARSLCQKYNRTIVEMLREHSSSLGNVRVVRYHEIGSRVVQKQPAVSISVKSHLVHSDDVSAYMRNIRDADGVIGFWAEDKNSSFKGEISRLVGYLGKERKRLLSVSQNPKTRAILERASDNEPVFSVESGLRKYDYAASCLNLIVRLDYLDRFRVSGSRAISELRIDPRSRHRLTWKIGTILRLEGILSFGFDSQRTPQMFSSAEEQGVSEEIEFEDGYVDMHDPRRIMKNLRDHGIYRVPEHLSPERRIRACIMNASGGSDTSAFIQSLQSTLGSLGFSFDIVDTETTSDIHRASFEKYLCKLNESKPDVVLGILPDAHVNYDGFLYRSLKILTVGRGIASQGVKAGTLGNRYAIDNIALGILGKVGCIPYVLAKPLEFADLVVGIDIAREKKKHLDGSMNTAAMARVYFSNGEFVRYTIQDAPLEGETIPVNILQNMFPISEFGGKRVVIHRDGWFRGDEKRALADWGREADAELYLVDVVKSGAPRMYSATGLGSKPKGVSMPRKGDVFLYDKNNALVVSSLPPFKNATPQPLHVRVEPGLSLRQGIESVLKLTYLHYGSLRPPKLPVTTHYADVISYMVLRGIKPPSLEGSEMFWL